MDITWKEFLTQFMFEDGDMGLAFGHPSKLQLKTELPESLPEDIDVYFTPALRDGIGTEKADVVGSVAVWVDVDDPRLPRTTFPPSMVVSSGHGWHMYWLLDKPMRSPDLIENLNKVVLSEVPTADKGAWNVNRVLRVPGTLNSKEPIAHAQLKTFQPALRYSVQDFNALNALNRKTKHKIKTGDRRGYKSRSERDWAVITALITAGASDDLITRLFEFQPIGDKLADSGPKYLSRTLEKARTSNAVKTKEQDFKQKEDGYYVYRARGGDRRVSTFTITPKILLDGSPFDTADAIIGDVSASGFEWTDIHFSRAAFTSVRKFDAEAPVAAWQWLGNDNDIRKLLPFLMEELVGNGLPRVVATPTIGFHIIEGVPHYVGDSQTMTHSTLWEGYGGDVAWLPNKREHPKLELKSSCSKSTLSSLRELIPLLNEPQSLYPMLGWYSACPLKPWLEDQGLRFPILNVTGSRGSGKTTLIQRVMMPLFGQSDPKSYDAGTTRFVTLALLGSTNSVPIAFSEFRFESVEKFLRFVLLSYDTGHDPRGRPDQTTVDYPLQAPFSLDGEDIITDPAARQRIIVSLLRAATIDEDTEAYRAYNKVRTLLPNNFGGYYMNMVLNLMHQGKLESLLAEAREEMHTAFPSLLPDRVRNNHIVSYFGLKLWCMAVGEVAVPSAGVMEQSIKTVYNTSVGRGRMLVDDLVEDVINECAASTTRFKWDYDSETSILYFQLATAHAWWIEKRRRQGRGALERDSLRQQLREVHYARKPIAREGTWMFGIHLPSARESDLDVPEHIHLRTLTVRF